jgi:hypothetical protein
VYNISVVVNLLSWRPGAPGEQYQSGARNECKKADALVRSRVAQVGAATRRSHAGALRRSLAVDTFQRTRTLVRLLFVQSRRCHFLADCTVAQFVHS